MLLAGLDQVVGEAVPGRYTEAVTTSDVQPLGQPEIEITNKEYGQDLTFTAEVDVRPEIELPDLEGLKITVDPVEVTDEEVERVVNFLRQQGEPDYLDSVTDEAALDASPGPIGLGLSEAPANGEEAQYAQALQIVAREGKASTSFLQRKMRIGYNSAARLIERMEADGHVSQPDHVGRRQVLIGGGEDREPDSAPW